MSIKEIADIADGLGWKVEFSEHESRWAAVFSQYSPAGEDFSFLVLYENVDDIPSAVKEECESFNEEDHVMMWLEAKKNGVSGVPALRDFVDDAEEIHKMMSELANKLEGEAE